MLTTKEKISRMDRRITFKKILESANEEFNTQEKIGLQNIAIDSTVWCEKLNNDGRESYEGYQLTEVNSSRFRIRYHAGFTPENWEREVDGLVFEGLYYDIVSVRETTRRRYVEVIGVQKGKYVEENNGFGYSTGFSTGFDA